MLAAARCSALQVRCNAAGERFTHLSCTWIRPSRQQGPMMREAASVTAKVCICVWVGEGANTSSASRSAQCHAGHQITGGVVQRSAARPHDCRHVTRSRLARADALVRATGGGRLAAGVWDGRADSSAANHAARPARVHGQRRRCLKQTRLTAHPRAAASRWRRAQSRSESPNPHAPSGSAVDDRPAPTQYEQIVVCQHLVGARCLMATTA